MRQHFQGIPLIKCTCGIEGQPYNTQSLGNFVTYIWLICTNDCALPTKTLTVISDIKIKVSLSII